MVFAGTWRDLQRCGKSAVKFLVCLIEGHRSMRVLRMHQPSVAKSWWFMIMVAAVVVYPRWGARPGFVVENMKLASFLGNDCDHYKVLETFYCERATCSGSIVLVWCDL